MLLDKVGAIEVEIKGLKEEIRRSYEDMTAFQKAVFGLLCHRLNDEAPCNSCGGVATTQSKKEKEVSESREGYGWLHRLKLKNV